MIKNVRLVGRQDNMVDIMIPDRTGVSAYKIWVSPTLEGAYDLNPATTGLVEILELSPQQVYVSPSLKRQGREKQMGSNRGITRVVFNINDFSVNDPNVPNDDQQFYLRVQEVDMSGTGTSFSPILIVPPPEFYYFQQGTLTLVATIPDTGLNQGDLPNNSAISFIVPKFASYVHMLQTGGTGQLLYSPIESMPLINIPSGGLNLFSCANKQFIFSTDGGSATFQLFVSVVLEGSL